MLKPAATSDPAEETLQTCICQTRYSFSLRRRGHLLSQPSPHRPGVSATDERWRYTVAARLKAEMNMLTLKVAFPNLEEVGSGGGVSPWGCVAYA